MTAARIFATDRPSAIGARVLPIDPREQATLDELRRRRAAREIPGRTPNHA